MWPGHDLSIRQRNQVKQIHEGKDRESEVK